MAELDVTKKLDVYHALYRLNLSFAAIVRRCGELQQARVFRPKYLKLFQGFAQELQAEMNSEFMATKIPTTYSLKPMPAASNCAGKEEDSASGTPKTIFVRFRPCARVVAFHVGSPGLTGTTENSPARSPQPRKAR
jgi:hypothetical protein